MILQVLSLEGALVGDVDVSVLRGDTTGFSVSNDLEMNGFNILMTSLCIRREWNLYSL